MRSWKSLTASWSFLTVASWPTWAHGIPISRKLFNTACDWSTRRAKSRSSQCSRKGRQDDNQTDTRGVQQSSDLDVIHFNRDVVCPVAAFPLFFYGRQYIGDHPANSGDRHYRGRGDVNYHFWRH